MLSKVMTNEQGQTKSERRKGKKTQRSTTEY